MNIDRLTEGSYHITTYPSFWSSSTKHLHMIDKILIIFSFKLPKIILTTNWKATRGFTTGTNFILRRYYTQKRMLLFSLRAQCFGRIRTKTIYPQKPTCQFRRSLISYGTILNVKNTNCINTYISYVLWS